MPHTSLSTAIKVPDLILLYALLGGVENSALTHGSFQSRRLEIVNSTLVVRILKNLLSPGLNAE